MQSFLLIHMYNIRTLFVQKGLLCRVTKVGVSIYTAWSLSQCEALSEILL